MTGEIYPPPVNSVSLRNADPEPHTNGGPRFMVASAEALSYAVAHGVIGDPRAFKRPARVTVPRVLPTEDVLVVRRKGQKKGPGPKAFQPPELPPLMPWKAPTTLEVVAGLPNGHSEMDPEDKKTTGIAVVLAELDQVRCLSETLTQYSPRTINPVRAVIAPYIPSQVVSALASEGIASFQATESDIGALGKQKSLNLPKASSWGANTAATAGKSKVELRWLAIDREQKWTHAGRSSAS
jgi:aconitate hydratase